MKNFKELLFTLVAGAAALFGYLYFTRGDGYYKRQLKELENHYADLEKQKKSIDSALVVLDKEHQVLKAVDSINTAKIQAQEKAIAKAEARADRARIDLDNMKSDLANTRKEIEEAKQKPANREGESLLNSLKIKSQP